MGEVSCPAHLILTLSPHPLHPIHLLFPYSPPLSLKSLLIQT